MGLNPLKKVSLSQIPAAMTLGRLSLEHVPQHYTYISFKYLKEGEERKGKTQAELEQRSWKGPSPPLRALSNDVHIHKPLSSVVVSLSSLH